MVKIVKETEYLVFTELPAHDDRKTLRWGVNSKSGASLGTIYWFNRWRQYVFDPYFQTIYNKQCLKEISDFLIDHKNSRR